VRLHAFEAAITIDHERRSGTFNDATTDLEAFLAARGHSSRGFIFNKAIRYREGVVEPGEQVAVCGRASREVDPAPDSGQVAGYREMPTRLVLTASTAEPILIRDDPAAATRG
jgi:hypothetical protein